MQQVYGPHNSYQLIAAQDTQDAIYEEHTFQYWLTYPTEPKRQNQLRAQLIDILHKVINQQYDSYRKFEDHITSHLGTHVKDNSSRRGLLKLVAQRRKLLNFVKDHSEERYQKIINGLGLRR